MYSKLTMEMYECVEWIQSYPLMVSFILRKIFLENLNKPISLVEITSFRFPRKIFLKRKLNLDAWCPLKDHTYLNKPAAESVKPVQHFN